MTHDYLSIAVEFNNRPGPHLLLELRASGRHRLPLSHSDLDGTRNPCGGPHRTGRHRAMVQRGTRRLWRLCRQYRRAAARQDRPCVADCREPVPAQRRTSANMPDISFLTEERRGAGVVAPATTIRLLCGLTKGLSEAPQLACGIPTSALAGGWYARLKAAKSPTNLNKRGVLLGTRMTAYILRRLLLIVPTMIGIMLVTFVIVQFAPGGPVERLIAQLTGTDAAPPRGISGGGGDFGAGRPPRRHAGRRVRRLPNIAARRASTRNSSRASRSSSASTSRPMSASS